jgi:hypothetical protein
MSAGSKAWPINMYEPLTIGFLFLFLLVRPWQILGTPKMLYLSQTLPKMLQDTNMATGHLLRKICQQMWQLCTMSEDAVRRMLASHPNILFHVKQKESFDDKDKSEEDEERGAWSWGNKHRAPYEYLAGRNGDHLMIPFECDLCIFRKLCKQDPLPTSESDKLLLACIRRISLDAFWSQASSTITANRDKLKQALGFSQLVGLSGPYEHFGTMPINNTFSWHREVRESIWTIIHSMILFEKLEWFIAIMLGRRLKQIEIHLYWETIR